MSRDDQVLYVRNPKRIMASVHRPSNQQLARVFLCGNIRFMWALSFDWCTMTARACRPMKNVVEKGGEKKKLT
jgi:hypothetical protein